MWSLPNLTNLNSNAADKRTKRRIRDKLRYPHRVPCEHCSKPSVEVAKWYDVFSNDAKGVVGMCEEHYDTYGGLEGDDLFTCENCERLFASNYTWEMYSYQGCCLNCARNAYIADESNWYDADTEITKEMIAKAPHLIAVGMTTPPELDHVVSETFDGSSLEGIYGSDGLGSLNHERKKEDSPYILILDGAYQFCASVGLYYRSTK